MKKTSLIALSLLSMAWNQAGAVAPSSTPVPNQPITVSTINALNTFISRVFFRMQDEFDTGGAAEEIIDRNSDDNPDPAPRRNKIPAYMPTFSAAELPSAPSHTIAGQLAAADPKLGFLYFQPKKQEKIRSDLVVCDIITPWHFYIGPRGDVGTIVNKNHQYGAGYRIAGFLTGFDYVFSQVGLGFMVDYENIKADLHKHGGDFWINEFRATTYATYVPDAMPQFAVNGILGSGGSWYNIQRDVEDLPKKEIAKGTTRGAQVDALVGSQFTFDHRMFNLPLGLALTPMFNLQYIYQGIGGYKEQGAGASDLHFHNQGFQSLRSTLGTWVQYTWAWETFAFTQLFDLAWQREYLDRHHTLHSTPRKGPGHSGSTTIFGAGRDTMLTGIDFMFTFFKKYGIEASYDFEWNSLYRNNVFYVGFDLRF